MPTRLLSGLAIWALIVGCCYAFAEPSGAASPPASAISAAPSTAVPSRAFTRGTGDLWSKRVPAPKIQPRAEEPAPGEIPSAGRQMESLDRRARTDMILYKGRFDRSDFVLTMPPIERRPALDTGTR